MTINSIWAEHVAAEAVKANSYTIGLLNGSHDQTDRRVLNRLVLNIATLLQDRDAALTTMLVRFDDKAQNRAKKTEAISKSPLGPWFEMVQSNHSEEAIETCSKQLPTWKQSHRLILIDLGAMDTSLSRQIGRLCDVCYLLLGPSRCGSLDWIAQHISLHGQDGTVLAGSLVAHAA